MASRTTSAAASARKARPATPTAGVVPPPMPVELFYRGKLYERVAYLGELDREVVREYERAMVRAGRRVDAEPTSAGFVVIDKKGRVALREPTNHYGGYHWTFAKGQVEAGDDMLKTAERELLEEMGIKAKKIGELGVYGGTTSATKMFLGEFQKKVKEPHWETQSVKWHTWQEAEEAIKLTETSVGRERDLKILADAKAEWEKQKAFKAKKAKQSAKSKAKKIAETELALPYTAPGAEATVTGLERVKKKVGLAELDYGRRYTIETDTLLANQVATKTNLANGKAFETSFEAVPGFDPLVKEPWLRSETDKFVKTNVDLITSIPEKHFEEIRGIVADAWQKGTNVDVLTKKFQERFGVSQWRARLIARDQVSKLNGQLNMLRQTDQGITHYVWRTSLDERVRETHKSKEGERFAWAEPPDDTGHPGNDYQCRCTAEPDIESMLEELEKEPEPEPEPELIEQPQPKEPEPFVSGSDMMAKKLAEKQVKQKGLKAGDIVKQGQYTYEVGPNGELFPVTRPVPMAAPRPAPPPMVKKPKKLITPDGPIEADLLSQVGGQMGSVPGALYQDLDGEKWYIKTPSSPGHAYDELVANRIYRKLGIEVPELRLATRNGQVSIASKWVDGLTQNKIALTTGKVPDDVIDGFGADALLANWDVVGLNYDNMAQLPSGKWVRVDAGGSLRYRAQGQKKGSAFGDDARELYTLRDPSLNPQAASVFGRMTDDEVIRALDKLDGLNEAAFMDIIDEIGIRNVERYRYVVDEIPAKLERRRKFLMRERDKLRTAKQPSAKRTKASTEAKKKLEKPKATGDDYYLKQLDAKDLRDPNGVVIVDDEGSIENLAVRFRNEIDVDGKEYTYIRFTMTDAQAEAHMRHMAEKGFEGIKTKADWTPSNYSPFTKMNEGAGGKFVAPGQIIRDKDLPAQRGAGGECRRKIIGNMTIEVKKAHTKRIKPKQYHDGGTDLLSTQNRVEIRVPAARSKRTTLKRYREALEVLGIPGGYGPPPKVALEQYAKARAVRQWSRKHGAEYARKGNGNAAKLEKAYEYAAAESRRGWLMKEVVEEYVENGPVTVAPGVKALFSKKQASYAIKEAGIEAIYHDLGHPDALLTIFGKNGGGLFASNERFTRGMLVTGMSTGADFVTGGADAVFMRLAFNSGSARRAGYNPRLLIRRDKVLGRSDWWAYAGDKYGVTSAYGDPSRLTVESLVNSKGVGNNEIMVKDAVAPEDIIAVLVNDNESRREIIKKLRSRGITNINGKKVEDFVHVSSQYGGPVHE